MRRLELAPYPSKRSAPEIPKRTRYLQRHSRLKLERQSWDPHWQDISTYVQPRKSRFLQSKNNSGQKKHGSIINSTAGMASRILASGMMAGITSPARAWFRLTTPDPDLAEFGAVKQWLFVVESRVRQAFARSNIYNGLHQSYQDIGDFGITANYVEDDPEDILRSYVLPIGRYCLASSSRQRIDTLYDEPPMTVAQVVDEFGLEKVSSNVREQYQRGDLDAWVKVVHVIEPNLDLEHGKRGPKGMKWKSCWFELATDKPDLMLRESGYEEFPVLCPRWNVTGEDVYGSSPGMDALGDVKALQLLERRKAQAVDKIVDPPMVGPAELQNQAVSLLPGSLTYLGGAGPVQAFRPAFEINHGAIPVLDATIEKHERRINSAYYADLWLMMANRSGDDMTAREVAERHEEKMLQLGPVMERLQDELLDPLIDRAFAILLRNGDLPPPPEELQGIDLRVEYTSVMAQAQRMLGITGVERLAAFVGNLAAVKPDVVDKIDLDQCVDEMSGMLGVPPALVRTDEAVAQLRAGRAQAQQQAVAMEQAAVAAQGAKTLSETDMESDSALTRLIGGLGGVAGATPSGMVQ